MVKISSPKKSAISGDSIGRMKLFYLSEMKQFCIKELHQHVILQNFEVSC